MAVEEGIETEVEIWVEAEVETEEEIETEAEIWIEDEMTGTVGKVIEAEKEGSRENIPKINHILMIHMGTRHKVCTIIQRIIRDKVIPKEQVILNHIILDQVEEDMSWEEGMKFLLLEATITKEEENTTPLIETSSYW